jgi:IS30 family transposase
MVNARESRTDPRSPVIAEAVRTAIRRSIITLPDQLRRSLTWDQGAETTQHVDLRIDTRLQTYFCDPHSPWRHATNEKIPMACYANRSPRELLSVYIARTISRR